ncbi:hypothetical protein M446_4687 [Methylobacterium sp. 4-46]|nr:hypothetical protein M446_4687 [Methylobacterium sp. 4-46]
MAPATSAIRTDPQETPMAQAVPPGLLLDDVPQRLLLHFAGLSVRAQQLREDELARRLDRAALLAAAAWLRSQHGPIPPRADRLAPATARRVVRDALDASRAVRPAAEMGAATG